MCSSDPLPVSNLSLQSGMSSQALSLGRSEGLGSITDSVAKLFSLSKEKGQTLSPLPFRDRLEEPETLLESAYSQPNIAKGLLLGQNITVEDGRHSLSFTKLKQAEKRRIDLQSSGPARERRTRQTPLSSGLSLGAHHASQILLRAKSLLQSPERENIAFQQYSLPSETAVRPSVIPLLPLNQEYPSLAEFRTLKTIGRGTFARVLAVQHISSGLVLALKVLKKINVLRQKQLQHILSEKSILARTNHPFVVRLYSAYQDREKLYLLMELACGGQLFGHDVKPVPSFSLEAARFYTASILIALEYLHANSVIYRDLKPENLLLDEAGFLKITDLGFAKEVSGSGKTFTQCGTPEYLAPEIIGREGHGKAVDWWSMGVILYEMLIGRLPFSASNHPALFKLILAGEFEIPKSTDHAAQDLIRKLLRVDASTRLGSSKRGSQDIKRHPFFQGFNWRDLITGKAAPPKRPKYEGSCNLGNFRSFEESIDDPTSPILDQISAEVIFRGF